MTGSHKSQRRKKYSCSGYVTPSDLFSPTRNKMKSTKYAKWCLKAATCDWSGIGCCLLTISTWGHSRLAITVTWSNPEDNPLVTLPETLTHSQNEDCRSDSLSEAKLVLQPIGFDLIQWRKKQKGKWKNVMVITATHKNTKQSQGHILCVISMTSLSN
jgi:hypothetical protein